MELQYSTVLLKSKLQVLACFFRDSRYDHKKHWSGHKCKVSFLKETNNNNVHVWNFDLRQKNQDNPDQTTSQKEKHFENVAENISIWSKPFSLLCHHTEPLMQILAPLLTQAWKKVEESQCTYMHIIKVALCLGLTSNPQTATLRHTLTHPQSISPTKGGKKEQYKK